MLKGKHIVLGISGGIAAYKAATLIRLLVKAGAEVQPVITPSGKEFITPVTLSALCHKPVISEFFTANTGEWHSHIDIGLWADAMVIAPATACTIAKMATGVADNMLVTTYLSARSQVFVAPAMDLDMMAHPSTERNLRTLRADGVRIIEPESGELASGLTGRGRMAEPEHIVRELNAYFSSMAGPLAGRRLLVTAGPTYERIDPVRFIGNFSTGKMGYAIADAAARRGMDVTLVSGPVAIEPTEPGVKVVKVESARQMLAECSKVWPEADGAVMCAAVADYAPAHPADSKIKREGAAAPTIELVKNPDIAATLGAEKRPGQVLVGFALETGTDPAEAAAKLERKRLDMCVFNTLADPGAGFGTDTNKVTLVYPDRIAEPLPVMPKSEVAEVIIDSLEQMMSDRK